MKVNTLTLDQGGYPERLRHIADPPKSLHVIGDLKSLQGSSISVVGSRKVSPYGQQVTNQLVSEVARAGVTIVSGLALGVDSLAHRAALDAGTPTIAVLPSGLDAIYPRSHYQLASAIVAAGGALISEYPEGTAPLKHHFIARNRIVSGLSQAVLITEATERSGSLHTANFALEQGRTVMVVPGNISSPNSQGTNNLLKTGAVPITAAADIFLELGIEQERLALPLADTPAEAAILDLLQAGISSGQELLERSQLSTQEFQQSLTSLEISQKVRALGANRWSVR